MRTLRRMTVTLLASALVLAALSGPALAQDPSDVALDSPIRALLLAPSETRIDLDVNLFNFADTRRLVTFTIEGVPEGWDIDIWNAFYDFRISEIVVEPTEDTPGQRPRMRVRLPAERPAPGDYSFTLILTDTNDPGIEYDRAKFTIGVPPANVEEEGEVSLRTDFPILRGPANTSYEFELVVKNDTNGDRSFNLVSLVIDESQQPQQGWEIAFTPAFGEQKQISNISILEAVDERINVNVTPPLFVDPGNYFIPVTVTSEGDEYSADFLLALQLIGRGELVVSTETNVLSMDATAGEAATNTVRLINFGTGAATNIELDADTPSDWEVEFQLEVVEILGANEQIDIQVTVVPADDAIPGDYEIVISGRSSEGIFDDVTIRVTVDQSTIWGWLGFILVVIVVGGLMGVFWRLGRR